MTKPGAGKGPKRGRGHPFTAEEKARALEVLAAAGLAAAAAAVGTTKPTVLRWAKAAGIGPDQYAKRSTGQNVEAARAAVAARLAANAEHRATLSTTLVEALAPQAVDLIARRLTEELALEALIAEDEEELAKAVESLRILSMPDDPRDPKTPDELKVIKALRAEAREALKSAVLIARAHRDARTKVPELVGVMTRAINDHLRLEGMESDQAASTGTIHVTLTAPRPARTPSVDVVTLAPETSTQEALR